MPLLLTLLLPLMLLRQPRQLQQRSRQHKPSQPPPRRQRQQRRPATSCRSKPLPLRQLYPRCCSAACWAHLPFPPPPTCLCLLPLPSPPRSPCRWPQGRSLLPPLWLLSWRVQQQRPNRCMRRRQLSSMRRQSCTKPLPARQLQPPIWSSRPKPPWQCSRQPAPTLPQPARRRQRPPQQSSCIMRPWQQPPCPLLPLPQRPWRPPLQQACCRRL